MDTELTHRFCDLFDGNHAAVGKVWGEALDIAPHDWVPAIQRHLTHEAPEFSAGVYPLVALDDLPPKAALASVALQDDYGFTSDLWVKWGCTDLDDGYEQSWGDAQRIVSALEYGGITAFVERTKSKGWHVWVFARHWTPAEVMRRALLAAHQAAGVRPTEVNPKQTSLEGLKGYGNYVNLPYHAGTPMPARFVHYDNGDPMDLDTFVELAHEMLTDFGPLLAMARLYVEPPKPSLDGPIVEYDGSLDDLTTKLSGLAFVVFKDGPLEGHDRSDTLAKLCHKVRESGLDAGECMTLLRDADKRWGKFHSRPDCDEQLEKLVINAYGGTQ